MSHIICPRSSQLSAVVTRLLLRLTSTSDCITEIMWIHVLAIAACLSLSSTEPGSCPPTLPVDICDAACGPEKPCVNSTQLCCPTACGGAMCVDPVTRRHFVNLVKKGRCPEYPRGEWICTHTCTGDSDCPRALKCCPNRCGARKCQKPEANEEPPQALL